MSASRKVVIIVGVSLTAFWFVAAEILQRKAAEQTGTEVSVEQPICSPDRRTLVVTLHGLGGDNSDLMSLRA